MNRTIPYLSLFDLLELALPEMRHYRGAAKLGFDVISAEFFGWLQAQAKKAVGGFLVTVIVALILYWIVEKKLELF